MKTELSPIENPTREAFYGKVMYLLQQKGFNFVVGGTRAMAVHIPHFRRSTKDLDLFLLKEDALRALEVLKAEGYHTNLKFPHWLGKVYGPEDACIDIIFASGNGFSNVDKMWFEHARSGIICGVPCQISPPEEMIWSKGFLMERERCDFTDVLLLIDHFGQDLDWERVAHRFGQRWRVLFALLILYTESFPGRFHKIPEIIWEATMLLVTQWRGQPGSDLNYGTLLSRAQLNTIPGVIDARLQPIGSLTPADIQRWTDDIPPAAL